MSAGKLSASIELRRFLLSFWAYHLQRKTYPLEESTQDLLLAAKQINRERIRRKIRLSTKAN